MRNICAIKARWNRRAAYIADLAQSHVSAANAEYYAKLVRDKSIQRGLIEAGAKIVSTGFDTSKDLAGLIDEAEQSVMAVSSRTSSGGFRPVQALVGDVVDAVLKPAEGGITGLATGYPELDAITRGLQPSDLIIIAARPAMGKTALALNPCVPPSAKARPWAFSRWKCPNTSLSSV